MVYSEPELWEAAKRAARERLGGHSARAMQLAGQLYRAAGGRYLGRKTKAQQSLSTWTRQDWTTKSGKPSRETGERYLPKRVIEQLTTAEYAATSRAKRKGTKQGKQYVKQPPKIAAKVARLKAQTNPRPRKYASAAEKQAAFRARFPTLCVRVEPKTADTVQAVADASGRTQQETLLSMLKYAMTNRNWLTLGLTEHKQLPRIEEPRKENPMKRKPTPAQIAARERFAAMARSGAFKRKARKVKSNPISYGLDGVVNITDTYERSVASSRNLAEHYANQLRMRGREDIVYVVFGITPQAKAQAGRLRNGVTITLDPRDYEIAYAFHPTQGEISRQLKAQRDAERRAYTRQGMKLKSNPGKVKRNPISDIANIIYNQLGANRFAMMTGAKNFVAGDDFLMFSIGKNQSVYNKVRITLTPDDLYDLEFFKMNRLGDISKTQKFEGVYAEQLQDLFTQVTGLYTSMGTMGRRSNPRASNPINTGIKYACIMPEPGGMAFGIDERTPVTIRFSASELKRAYKCYLIPATVRESAGYQRLIAKQKEVYMSLAELKQLFRSFI